METSVRRCYSRRTQADILRRPQPEDYSKLKERQLFYVVSVPGETEWFKEVRLSRLSMVAESLIPSTLQNFDKSSVSGATI